MRNYFYLCMLIFGLSFLSFAQESNFREYTLKATKERISLDTLSIYPNSFSVFCGDQKLDRSAYELHFSSAEFQLLEACSDSIRIQYRVLPMKLNQVYKSRDTSLLYVENKGDRDRFLLPANETYTDIFGTSALKKNGSISRGVSFGNNQDLSVNSTLNLELSGDISPNLKLLASVSDDNLPIQPDGNTNKLQEFDQVFIQLYNEKFKLIAGDFWLKKPTGYFMTYNKRAQGLYGDYSWKTGEKSGWKVQGSGAMSKGKFARQIIQGVEGNQGPYRLKGVENEPFIIVLSGTESVFIDGRLLQRGQEFDYVINYNTAEVIFTSRNLITKDVRIVIEFQYTDQNYARFLMQGNATYSSEKLNFWINAYSEQDAKNQTIQQDLTLSQKKLLAEIGDSLELARTNSIDSIGFLDNQNLYKLVSISGFDSVLVYSVDPDSAYYRAVFTEVGPNQGDYVLSSYNALGKVYQWVQPIFGVPQGNFIPARIIITPKLKQMVSAGISYQIRKNLVLESELAYTKEDLNTFSRLDAQDDNGYSNRTRLLGTIPLGKDSLSPWILKTRTEFEVLHRNFSPIQQYRAVEFDRDWNTRNKGYVGNQLATTLEGNFVHKKYGNLALEAAQFSVGTDYEGYKTKLSGNWRQKGFQASWEGSALSSSALGKNEYIRHKLDVSQAFKKIRFGFKDDQELNRFQADGILSNQSYSFYDYEFYVSNADSAKFDYRLFYRERIDLRSDSVRLIHAAKAKNAGGEISVKSNTQNINFILNYRELSVENAAIINNQTPENTLLGRVDYELKLWKSAFTWNTFYEIGSGLELKREFQYVKVNDGQGIYTWIDYNEDGIKDLNEFEIAQYVDQASYIRVFTPSSEYVKTYSNEFNQSVFLKPERVWANQKGAKKFFSRFSDQARVRINRKTNTFKDGQIFNPFSGEVRDTNLISTNTNVRNSLYFNRTNTIFGAEYQIQDIRSKTLLASGFDSRVQNYQEISFRWNIVKVFSIENEFQWGTKSVTADYTTGRNYDLNYYFTKPTLSYQPNTSFRLSLESRFAEKRNVDGELAVVRELGIRIKYNEPKKGSLQGNFSLISISYNGQNNSALGFEMLEALKPGKNFTWDAGYQRSISKNLQLSVQYNGRKSENNKTIHSGGMEVRAFF